MDERISIWRGQLQMFILEICAEKGGPHQMSFLDF